MKLSIVVPCYNQAQYLEECIESVYNQTVPPYEIIIVNDGSTDNTQEIAERYTFKQFPGIESPVRVIRQVNKGLPSARNTGIMAATGEFIWFLDADDILVENAVEKMTLEIAKTLADIYAPSFQMMGLRNEVVNLQTFNIEDFKVANRIGYFSVIRRSLLVEAGGYSPRMKHGYEDYHLWFDLFCRQARLTIMPDVLVNYRVKEHSMIHDAQTHHEELMGQIRKDFPNLWT